MNTLLDYFGPYNKRIFPLQIVMAVIAIGLVGLLFWLPSVTSTILVNAFLGITFGWIGVAFLFLVGDMRERIPFASYATAVTYLPLVIIFITDVFTKQTAYKIPQPGWQLYGSFFVMFWGIILYPLSGYLIGHRYPRLPLFGAMPCPTNIFAIGVLTAFASNSLEITALFILSSMAVVGAVKAAILGYDGARIREDFALLAGGIYGLLIGLAVL
jgi:Family of unknown function (DUF6064)